MNKILKVTTIGIMIITCLFLITGCDSKDEKKDSEIIFKIDQISESDIKVTLKNVRKGNGETARLVIPEGKDITTTTKLEGTSGVNAYFFKAGSNFDKANADYELLNGEGESTTEGFPAGEYEVLFEVDTDGTTGTIEMHVK